MSALPARLHLPDAVRGRIGRAPAEERGPRLPMLREAVPELTRLTAAMDAHRPACRGDTRFTADSLTDAEIDRLRPICARCPIEALCEAYAAAATPPVGFWAGRRHPIREETHD